MEKKERKVPLPSQTLGDIPSLMLFRPCPCHDSNRKANYGKWTITTLLPNQQHFHHPYRLLDADGDGIWLFQNP